MSGDIAKNDLDPEVVAYIDALESEVDALTTQIVAKDAEITDLTTTLSKSAPKDAESAAEIEKSLLAKADPAVRALIEKQSAEIAKANEIAKAEREQRLEREFVAKAETLPMLAEDRVALAGLLRRISDAVAPEDVASLEKVLKAANTAIAQSGLFSEVGTFGGQTTVSKSVESAAAEIKKAHPDWTDEQCQAEAYDRNPALLQQALTDQEG